MSGRSFFRQVKTYAKFVPARVVDYAFDKTVYADKRRIAVELVFCQGGAGGGSGLLAPALGSALRYLSGADVVIYADRALSDLPDDVECRVLKPPFADDHPQYEQRFSDWARGVGLKQSKADVAIYLDSGNVAVSRVFDRLAVFALRFGVCAPMNPNLLVKNIAASGQRAAALGVSDSTCGLGFAHNAAPMAASPRDPRAQRFLSAYCEKIANDPICGSLAIWKAAWATGVTPYLLPPQWCICEGWEGTGNQVVRACS